MSIEIAITPATQRYLRRLAIRPSEYLQIGIHTDDSEIGTLFVQPAIFKKPTLREAADPKVEKFTSYDRKALVKVPNSFSTPPREWSDYLFERRQLKTQWNSFYVPATDINCVIMLSQWTQEKIVFLSDEARMLFTLRIGQFQALSNRVHLQKDFIENRKVPAMSDDWRDHNEYWLSDYQRAAVRFCELADYSALYMEQGTGKTACVVNFISNEAIRCRRGEGGYLEPHKFRALVIGPRSVRLNWAREVEKFATVPGIVGIMRGTQIQRIKTLAEVNNLNDERNAFAVTVTTYDAAVNDISVLKSMDWDLVVTDESHMYKAPSSKRWKAIKELRAAARKRIELTGTPFGNTVFDLWTQLEFLCEGASGFKSFKSFRKFHGQFERVGQTATGGSFEKLVSYREIPFLQERLSRLAFRVTKEQARLGLPDKVYDIYEVEMTDAQSKIYASLAAKLVAQIESMGEVKEVSADHILTKLLRLAQITSGHVKWDEAEHVERLSASPKVEAVLDILANQTEVREKVIVWCTFKDNIKQLQSELTARGYGCVTFFGETSDRNKEAAIDLFNRDPSIKVFIGHPAAAGAGINLLGYDPIQDDQDTYCGRVIYFSSNWSHLQRDQAEDRAHRRGTKMPVKITDLIVPASIDEVIYDTVRTKKATAKTLLNLKGILSKVLNHNFSLTGN